MLMGSVLRDKVPIEFPGRSDTVIVPVKPAAFFPRT